MSCGNILVVEDIRLGRAIIKNIVEKHGYKVVGEASTGKEAISKYEELMPDLLITDIVMPEMDGLSAAAIIKSKHKDAKIIVCSSRSQVALLLEVFKIDIANFIVKPFLEHHLIQTITRALENSVEISHPYVKLIENKMRQHWQQMGSEMNLAQDEIDTLLNIISSKAETNNVDAFFERLVKRFDSADRRHMPEIYADAE